MVGKSRNIPIPKCPTLQSHRVLTVVLNPVTWGWGLRPPFCSHFNVAFFSLQRRELGGFLVCLLFIKNDFGNSSENSPNSPVFLGTLGNSGGHKGSPRASTRQAAAHGWQTGPEYSPLAGGHRCHLVGPTSTPISTPAPHGGEDSAGKRTTSWMVTRVRTCGLESHSGLSSG